jgi:undecaprenyl-phosphate 4-deoxy-4-formamido-L-arabinose transferase
MPPSISVVVPVYNSEESLPLLVKRLEPVLSEHAAAFELILVNDASRDGSWEVARGLAEAHPWVRAFCLMRNYGQHNALLCGIRAAHHDLVVTMDDDLQHPPEELPKLLAALADGADAVYGTPGRQQHGLLRDLASQITKLALQGAMGVDVARNVSAFRAFRTRLRDAFARYEAPLVNLDVLLTWGTTRFAAVEVRHDARTLGESNYTVRKLVVHALNMLTGFTTIPLQLATMLGFVSAAFGLVLLVFVVGRYLIQGAVVPGFAFLGSSIALFAGIQLFALGILGEYIARMHLRTMDKPAYTVRESAGADGAAPDAEPPARAT